ncbi:MAG: DNA photolyase family protein [Caldilineales bacterium]|nr:DNA photolyase family protein [Caldilineales bacterium]MDW8316844.1 deoxyribodipyrimidine photo-lyase [Anaerolineae bacterium]
MATAIWWVRRDLRLSDNQALSRALAAADQVVPVFVLDPALLSSPYVGEKRLAFLFDGLRSLDADLRRCGSRLIVRRGRPMEALRQLVAETGAQAIFAEADVTPYARRRDEAVRAELPLKLTPGLTVHRPSQVVKEDGAPYTVFTPFSKRWLSLPLPTADDLLPAPERIVTPAALESLPIPDAPALPAAVPFPAGEAEAQRRLAAFTQGPSAPITRYREDRNRPDLEGTSRLSPYLRFGMVSARQATVAARAARQAARTADACYGADSWLSELIWREFYVSILYHFPYVRTGSFQRQYDRIPWINDPEDFAAWCEGRTGYPIVDAAMRQLVQTGWMHNRCRMIVASFLVKDLLVDWRWGERFFMQHLVDGDPASNNGGWQWTAGVGTDAAPYFRVFNPVMQGEKFDPNGDYVRRWVPELGRVPTKYIHAPWTMPLAEQRRAGCLVGQDYPAPIVDHGQARERTLAAYAQARR